MLIRAVQALWTYRARVAASPSLLSVSSRHHQLASTFHLSRPLSTSSTVLQDAPVRKRTPPKPRVKKELPELVEAELIESFVRGSGPGGQATNKTSNACSLIHVPTGIRVVCHETRSRETNRKLARRIMRERLDQFFSPPGESRRDQEAERERRKKEAKRRKSKRKAANKAGEESKEPEGETAD
ncbi:hypothetical protein JCM3765_003232 [Sporobolomyces pararoseus]